MSAWSKALAGLDDCLLEFIAVETMMNNESSCLRNSVIKALRKNIYGSSFWIILSEEWEKKN